MAPPTPQQLYSAHELTSEFARLTEIIQIKVELKVNSFPEIASFFEIFYSELVAQPDLIKKLSWMDLPNSVKAAISKSTNCSMPIPALA